jgi:hypothetical protein
VRRTVIVAVGFALGSLAALLLYFAQGLQHAGPVTLNHPEWIETKWPFLIDQWGEGKAFECKAADCGGELKLYIRSKIGFCSSTKGVADDNELERLSDFDFIKGTGVALGDGHEIRVGWMKGRLRAYAIASPNRPPASAILIAYNNDNDALVVTVLLNNDLPNAIEPAVIKFLGGKEMLRWVKITLGL